MNKIWTQIWKTVCKGADVPTDTIDLQLAVNECLYIDDGDYSHITESNLFKAMYAASRDDIVRRYMQARYNKTALFSFFECSSWQEILDRVRSKPIIPFEVVLNMKRPSQAIQILHKLQFDTGDYTAIPIGNGSLDDSVARNVDTLVETCGMLLSPKWTFEKRKKALFDFIFKGKIFFRIKMDQNFYNMRRSTLRTTPGPANISPFVNPDDELARARARARAARADQDFPMLRSPPQSDLFPTPVRGAQSPPYSAQQLNRNFVRAAARDHLDWAYRNSALEQELSLFNPQFVRQLAATRGITGSIVEALRDIPMRYTLEELNQIATDPDLIRELAHHRNISLSQFDDQAQSWVEVLFNEIGLDKRDAKFYGYSDAALFFFAQHSNMENVTEDLPKLDKIQWIIHELRARKSFQLQLANLSVNQRSMRELIKQSCVEKFSRMSSSLLRECAPNMAMRTDEEVRDALMNECIGNSYNTVATKQKLVKAIIRNTSSAAIEEFINSFSYQIPRQQPQPQPQPQPRQQLQAQQSSPLLTARLNEFLGNSVNVGMDPRTLLTRLGVTETTDHPWWTLINNLQRIETSQLQPIQEQRTAAQQFLGVPNLKAFLDEEQAAVRNEENRSFRVANLGLVLKAADSWELSRMTQNEALVQIADLINDLETASARQLAVLNKFFNKTTTLAGIKDHVNAQNYTYSAGTFDRR